MWRQLTFIRQQRRALQQSLALLTMRCRPLREALAVAEEERRQLLASSPPAASLSRGCGDCCPFQTDRDRQRQTETDRDRQRQTDRQTDRQRQTDTDRDRQTQTETDRHRQRQTETDRDRQRQTETDRDRQRQTETETDRQTDGQLAICDSSLNKDIHHVMRSSLAIRKCLAKTDPKSP